MNAFFSYLISNSSKLTPTRITNELSAQSAPLKQYLLQTATEVDAHQR